MACSLYSAASIPGFLGRVAVEEVFFLDTAAWAAVVESAQLVATRTPANVFFLDARRGHDVGPAIFDWAKVHIRSVRLFGGDQGDVVGQCLPVMRPFLTSHS